MPQKRPMDMTFTEIDRAWIDDSKRLIEQGRRSGKGTSPESFRAMGENGRKALSELLKEDQNRAATRKMTAPAVKTNAPTKKMSKR